MPYYSATSSSYTSPSYHASSGYSRPSSTTSYPTTTSGRGYYSAGGYSRTSSAAGSASGGYKPSSGTYPSTTSTTHSSGKSMFSLLRDRRLNANLWKAYTGSSRMTGYSGSRAGGSTRNYYDTEVHNGGGKSGEPGRPKETTTHWP